MAMENITNHPFHPHHSLIRQSGEDNTYIGYGKEENCLCSTCNGENFLRNMYQCEHYPEYCQFRICLECINVKPNIRYLGHKHKLCFMKKIGDDVKCDADDCYSKRGFLSVDELDRTAYSFILRCVPCNFNIVHLLCGPLPHNIKYENHRHRLTLTRFVVEDDSGSYFCDACEEKRDGRICVYYCQECKYVVHIHCLIDQIISVLKGEVEVIKDLVHLSSTSKENETDDVEDKIRTLKDLVKSLSEEDKQKLEEHFDLHTITFELADSTYEESTHGSSSSTTPDEYFLPRSYSDFYRNVQRFDRYCNFRRLKLKPGDLKVNVVKVKNYTIAWYLEDTLLNLVEKHGDHLIDDHESKLTMNMKSLAFHFLCQVIFDMGRTMKKDMTEELLRDWYVYLKFVRRMGFRIEFVYDQLHKVKHDFFFLQPSKLTDVIPNKLLQKKSELQQQIKKVEVDIETCKESGNSIIQHLGRLRNKSYWDEVSKLKWDTADESVSRRA